MNLAEVICIACLLEATARKPGNVHPAAAFADLCYADFVASAAAIAPVLGKAARSGLGGSILDAVEATRVRVGRNTNLGIILLLAPLAAVPAEQKLSEGIGTVLRQTTVQDAVLVYRAIRAAQPGGMGHVSQQDLSDEPTQSLVDVMRLAAERDRIAQQYASDFRLVLEYGVPLLAKCTDFTHNWETAVISLHLHLMAEAPDTLIARKCGREIAMESASRARAVLDAGWPNYDRGRQRLQELDNWLRADGNRRNPGTTADLVTASLFAAIRDGLIEPPDAEHILLSVNANTAG